MTRRGRLKQLYDIIIIGTGAGGGTLAHALSETPARILILERGDFIPQEEENWDPEAVWKHLRYQTQGALARRAAAASFTPYSHYNVGGNSKFWGSVLYRLRREDFGELRHLDGVSPAWPIDYDTLAPYYDRAERLYQVHGEAGRRPDRPRRAAVSRIPPVPHSPGDGARSSSSCGRSGCIRRRCRSACSTDASSATPATRSRARSTRRARRMSAASGRRCSGRT